MIENLVVLLLIALLRIKAKDFIIGYLIFSYYAIFILTDIEFFEFYTEQLIITPLAVKWSTFMIIISLSYSVLAGMLYKRGSNIAGLYAFWLIINATVTLIEGADANNAYLVELIYNVTQNTNLLVELLVVTLGTGNIIHRMKYFERGINSATEYIDNLCNKTINLSYGSAQK